jgi:hypothetical protein
MRVTYEIQDNMPRRNDIQKILLIGAGPIVIGQACEFGTQAFKVLRDEGYYVILVNSKVCLKILVHLYNLLLYNSLYQIYLKIKLSNFFL